jgi:uncharacterized protein YndB with AHSA1/START domain
MTMAGAQAEVLAEVIDGEIVATVEIAAAPERVFRALSTAEIVNWWVNPGVFDTRAWSGDLQVGGRWRATGMARGAPYVLEGEFLEIDPPRKLVHTWHLAGAQEASSTVTYTLERIAIGTRLTVHHAGIYSSEVNKGTTAGWDASLRKLAKELAGAGR